MGQTTGAATDLVSVVRNTNGRFIAPSGLMQVAAPNVLRRTHDLVTLAPLGALVEGDGANLCPSSNDISSAAGWQVGGSPAPTDDPEGGNTGRRFTVPATGMTVPYMVINVDPNTVYTWGFFARLGTIPAGEMLYAIYNHTANSFIAVDIPADAALRTDRYQRLRTTFTTPSGCTQIRGYMYRKNGAGAGGTLDLAFPQLMRGTVLGSYIPTPAGATASRSADMVTLPLASVPYSPANDILAVEARAPAGAGAENQTLLQLDGGSEANRIRLVRDTARVLRAIVTTAGVEQANLALGTLADGADFKLAVSLQANNFMASLNGGAVVTDTSGTMPSVTTARIGASSAGEYWNSTIKRMKGLARAAASAAELQGLAA